jgi:hypothetical protein
MHASGLNLSKIENIFGGATITVQSAPRIMKKREGKARLLVNVKWQQIDTNWFLLFTNKLNNGPKNFTILISNKSL